MKMSRAAGRCPFISNEILSPLGRAAPLFTPQQAAGPPGDAAGLAGVPGRGEDAHGARQKDDARGARQMGGCPWCQAEGEMPMLGRRRLGSGSPGSLSRRFCPQALWGFVAVHGCALPGGGAGALRPWPWPDTGFGHAGLWARCLFQGAIGPRGLRGAGGGDAGSGE